jgi:hypothetical protein
VEACYADLVENVALMCESDNVRSELYRRTGCEARRHSIPESTSSGR